MRTTINIDDQLLQSAKHRIIEQGISLALVIGNAVRESLSKPETVAPPTRLVTVSSPGTKPGVDLDDSRQLREIMDD